jgi:alpha-glucuronidase
MVSISGFASAQANEVEMADIMRSNGKIYVVITVISVILLGLLIALINLDRKVKKIEKDKSKG